MNSSLNYSEFNKKILEFYLDRATTEFINLSIDDHEFSSLFPNFQIQDIISQLIFWNRLLHSSNTFPQYFGLIGLQCYAAFKMQKDKNYSQSAYKIRLKELMGYPEENDIQNLFIGDNKNNPVQENIWYEAKRYLFEKHGLTLNIPPRTIYAGRFVQYPKSQSLLNTQDLKAFTLFFSQEFRVKEEIPYNIFRNLVADNLQNLSLNSRTKNLLEDIDKMELCFHQIFNYYNKWEGEVYNLEKERSNKIYIVNQNPKIDQSLILRFDPTQDDPIFSLNGNDLDMSYIFDIEDYKYFHFEKKFLIFIEHEYYLNEFEDSRFFSADSSCYILTKAECNSIYMNIIKRSYSWKKDLSSELTLFKIHHFDLIQSVFKDLFPRKSSIKLVNGIRINRKKEYIYGYGPSINCEFEYTVFYNHNKVDYNYSNAPAGSYKIRIKGEKDIEFKIIEFTGIEQKIENKNLGWNFEDFNIKITHDLQGIGVNFLPAKELEITSVIKTEQICKDNRLSEWIRLNNQKQLARKVKYSGKNILLKNLNNL